MSSPYSRIWVYHTKHHMYLVGSHRGSAMFGVLRINRHDGAQLQVWAHRVCVCVCATPHQGQQEG